MMTQGRQIGNQFSLIHSFVCVCVFTSTGFVIWQEHASIYWFSVIAFRMKTIHFNKASKIKKGIGYLRVEIEIRGWMAIFGKKNLVRRLVPSFFSFLPGFPRATVGRLAVEIENRQGRNFGKWEVAKTGRRGRPPSHRHLPMIKS